MITWDAPNALAVSRHTRPIGPDVWDHMIITITTTNRIIPAPHINTLLPRDTPALLQECTATDNGSNNAAWSYDILLGNLSSDDDVILCHHHVATPTWSRSQHHESSNELRSHGLVE